MKKTAFIPNKVIYIALLILLSSTGIFAGEENCPLEYSSLITHNLKII